MSTLLEWEDTMRVIVNRWSSIGVGGLMAVLSAAGASYAGPPAPGVPEIDGVSIVAAIGFLGAGVMMLRARRSKR
jgi:hypothetical protein